MNDTDFDHDGSDILSWEGLQDMWALNDDDIDIYTVADDDIPYDIAGVPVVGVVLLTVVLSACVCSAIFYCSYRHEQNRRKRNCTDNSECQSIKGTKSLIDIENGLTLKQWDAIEEVFHDEEHTVVSALEPCDSTTNSNEKTENSTESPNGKCLIQFTAADIASASSKILRMNPAVAALAQKPRCLLCSKRFSGLDIVSASRDPTCHHHFHQTCIVSWLQKCDDCPICKKPYLNETFLKQAEHVAEESETGSSLSMGIAEGYEALDQSSLGEFSGIAPVESQEARFDTENTLNNQENVDGIPSQEGISGSCEAEKVEQSPVSDTTTETSSILREQSETTADSTEQETPVTSCDPEDQNQTEPTEDFATVEIV